MENKNLEEKLEQIPEVDCGIVKDDSILKNFGYNFLPIIFAGTKVAAGIYAINHIENSWLKSITTAYLLGSALLEGFRFAYVIPNTKDKQMVRSGLFPIESILAHNLRNYQRTNEYLDEKFREENNKQNSNI